MEEEELETMLRLNLLILIFLGTNLNKKNDHQDGKNILIYKSLLLIKLFLLLSSLLSLKHLSFSIDLIFGIIIGEFGSLREKTQKHTKDMEHHCFICHINKDTLEKNRQNFLVHINKKHNLKNDEKIFLFVGRLNLLKNILFIVDSLSVLKKKNPI